MSGAGFADPYSVKVTSGILVTWYGCFKLLLLSTRVHVLSGRADFTAIRRPSRSCYMSTRAGMGPTSSFCVMVGDLPPAGYLSSLRYAVDETHVVIRKEYLDDVNEILQDEVSGVLPLTAGYG